MQQLNFISSFLLASPFLGWEMGLRLWRMGGNHFTPEPRPQSSFVLLPLFFPRKSEQRHLIIFLHLFFLKILTIWVFGMKAISAYN